MTVRAAGPALVALLAALAVGCGSDSALLRDTEASGLKDTLQQVRSAVDARDCAAASARLRELRSDVGNLPGSVDRRLRVRLREEIVDKLAPAVAKECDDAKTETLKTTTTPAPTGPTGPAPEPTPEPEPEPEPTQSTPPPTVPPETTPVDPLDPDAPPPDEDQPEVPVPDPGGFQEEGG